MGCPTRQELSKVAVFRTFAEVTPELYRPISIKLVNSELIGFVCFITKFGACKMGAKISGRDSKWFKMMPPDTWKWKYI